MTEQSSYFKTVLEVETPATRTELLILVFLQVESRFVAHKKGFKIISSLISPHEYFHIKSRFFFLNSFCRWEEICIVNGM